MTDRIVYQFAGEEIPTPAYSLDDGAGLWAGVEFCGALQAARTAMAALSLTAALAGQPFDDPVPGNLHPPISEEYIYDPSDWIEMGEGYAMPAPWLYGDDSVSLMRPITDDYDLQFLDAAVQPIRLVPPWWYGDADGAAPAVTPALVEEYLHPALGPVLPAIHIGLLWDPIETPTLTPRMVTDEHTAELLAPPRPWVIYVPVQGDVETVPAVVAPAVWEDYDPALLGSVGRQPDTPGLPLDDPQIVPPVAPASIVVDEYFVIEPMAAPRYLPAWMVWLGDEGQGIPVPYPIIPDGLPVTGVPVTAHFTTQAGPVPNVALVSGSGVHDHTELVCICGSFEADDVIESAVFTAKLSTGGPVAIQKTITKLGPTTQGRIDAIADLSDVRALIFGLEPADNLTLAVAHVYTVQVTVTRSAVAWARTIQRGTIQSIPT